VRNICTEEEEEKKVEEEVEITYKKTKTPWL
jgi:hypothetical protein